MSGHVSQAELNRHSIENIESRLDLVEKRIRGINDAVLQLWKERNQIQDAFSKAAEDLKAISDE